MMIKVFLIVLTVLTLAFLVFFFLWKIERSKRKTLNAKYESVVRQMNKLIAQNANLSASLEITKKNREAADEKSNALHSGDSVGNALNVLQNK